MKTASLLLFLLLSFVNVQQSIANNSQFGSISFEKAANLSGEQGMLSQRIAKIIILSKIETNSHKQDKELFESIKSFENNLEALNDNSKGCSSDVKLGLRNQKREWKSFLEAIEESKKSLDSNTLMLRAEMLLENCTSLAIAIKQESDNYPYTNNGSRARLKVESIYKTANQRTLSQKIGLYYSAYRTLNREEKSTSIVTFKLRKAYDEMNKNLKQLAHNKLNNNKISKNIGVAKGLFYEIDKNKIELIKNEIPLSAVIGMTDKITTLFGTIVGQYTIL